MDIPVLGNGRSILIFGAGGLAQKMRESIHRNRSPKNEVVYVVDDEFFESSKNGTIPISRVQDEQRLIFGIGSGALRKKIYKEYGKDKFETIALGAIGESTQLDIGVTLTEFSYVQCCSRLGSGVLVNDATVCHHCVVGDWSTIGPRAVIGGGTELGSNCSVGMGALVREGLKVVDDVTIGMGAVVVKNIEEPGVYVGNPARKIK